MNRTHLLAIIAAVSVLIGLLDYWTSAELVGSVLFTFPLVLCVMQRSKRLLWATAAMASLLSVAAGVWSFNRIQLLNPWVASINRGLLIASLLTLATLIHLWINKSHKLMLEAAKAERHSNSLTARNEQLESELTKIKVHAKGKRKPLVLTIKQYQAFAGQLSDLHRTMVVTAMCTGMRVSEVLALRWDQLDFAIGRISVPHGLLNGRIAEAKTGASKAETPMDPVLLEALLDWRNKTPGAGLLFPSHITGRCYHAGPIQQDYFRPVARKLGLVGVCWHTFPNSYRAWMDEDGAAGAVQQRLMRHTDVSTVTNIRGGSALKTKPKAKRASGSKIVQRASPTVGFRVGVSAEAP
jgi:integrase